MATQGTQVFLKIAIPKHNQSESSMWDFLTPIESIAKSAMDIVRVGKDLVKLGDHLRDLVAVGKDLVKSADRIADGTELMAKRLGSLFKV